jgi:hypothetical protein
MPSGRESGLESRKGVDTGYKFGEGRTDLTASLTAGLGGIGRGVGEGSTSGGSVEEIFDPEIIQFAKNLGAVFRHPELLLLAFGLAPINKRSSSSTFEESSNG